MISADRINETAKVILRIHPSLDHGIARMMEILKRYGSERILALWPVAQRLVA